MYMDFPTMQSAKTVMTMAMALYRGITLLLSNLLILWYVYDVWWLGGNVQDAVFVVLQHFQHVALSAFFCYLAAARQGFVFGVLQFLLQLVYLYHVLLYAVSVGYVYDDKEHH